MRVTDLSIQQTYLTNLQLNKARLQKTQTQITTQSKVNTPSDDPLANSKIWRYGNRLTDLTTFKNNINTSMGFVQNTIAPMEKIQEEMVKIETGLTRANDATVDSNLDSFAQQIDLSIQTLLDLANTEFDGRFIFSGTDYSGKPFGYDATGKKIEVKLNDISGKQNTRISKNTTQKVNITGQELFQPVFDIRGNLDKSGAVGSVTTSTEKIIDPDGNEYTLTYNYTKTAANTYDLSYTVTDSSSSVIGSGGANNLVFNNSTGKLDSINGNKPKPINISIPGNKINVFLDSSNLREESSSSNLSITKNQEADIFNTLISIRDNLKNGIRPNDNQVNIVKNFNKLVTNKLSEAGNILNRMEDAQTLINSQELEAQRLLSEEKDVDMAHAMVDLQTQQFNLDINYKISSMILPKSLLDYL